MKKWERLGESETFDGNKISLWRRDHDYTIRVNGLDLMSTRQRHSEELLGTLACSHLPAKESPHILVGGLGMGFTLKSVLASVGPKAVVTVVELLPAVIEWNQNLAFPFAGPALKDSRVRIQQRDVVTFIHENGMFDSIILDVDNGPEALTTAGNQRLYDEIGLERIRSALRPGGCVAVWSVNEAPLFAKRLAKSGFKVETHNARTHLTSGGDRTIYLGRRS